MKLVVGLGNPGRQYQGTRHNVGFEVLNELAARMGVSQTKNRFDGQFAEAMVGAERVLLLWPETFMNRSGQSVAAARNFYQLANADVLIVCDDFSLPLGRLRFRREGSSGGQKGLEDVLRHCGSDVPRLRVGIGPVPENRDATRFVLERFAPEERPLADKVVCTAADGVLDWIEQGIDYCMNRYNPLDVATMVSATPAQQQPAWRPAPSQSRC